MNTFKVRNKQLNWLNKVSFEIILTEIEDMFKHLWYERFGHLFFTGKSNYITAWFASRGTFNDNRVVHAEQWLFWAMYFQGV